ncbi:hypothetical protein [Jeotgalibacillus soli]|uniref:Uncharacterized protein n=1 Tax=Jeotgalibacillus soli TaxID=889306 RepID=A0A0C2VLU3_9BACL|nr:hypothetical protein [Jeotgalibacillus soli]KIL45436.1 hypothetical protein KP78_29800 [Jeotgalibacillus soli]
MSKESKKKKIEVEEVAMKKEEKVHPFDLFWGPRGQKRQPEAVKHDPKEKDDEIKRPFWR